MIDDPWAVLGIDPTEDARAVKRAYAGRLKRTRPDEDPTGFQALSDAYEIAMREVRIAAQRALEAEQEAIAEDAGPAPRVPVAADDEAAVRDVDGHAAVSAGLQDPASDQPPDTRDAPCPRPMSKPAPYASDSQHVAEGLAHEPAHDPCPAAVERPSGTAEEGTDAPGRPVPSDPPPVDEPAAHADAAVAAAPDGLDFDAFFRELAEAISRRDPARLRSWLEAHEALYSIELKWAVLPYVFDAVARVAVDLQPSPADVDVLLDFFGVDARLRRHPAVAPALDYLQARPWERAHDEPAPDPAAAFDALVERYRSRRAPWADRLLLRELTGPWSLARRLFLLLVPSLPTRLVALWVQLAQASPTLADERLDAGSRAFWAQVTDRDRLHPRRFLPAAIRMPLLALLLAWVMNPGPPLAGWAGTAANAAIMLMGGSAAWTMGLTALRRFEALNHERLHWDLTLFWVTVMACTGLALALPGGAAGLTLLIVAGISWLGARVAEHPYVTAGAAIATGLEFGYPLFALVPTATWVPALAVAGAVGLHIAADAWVARRRRITLAEARRRLEGLGWSVGIAAAWMVVAAVLMQSLSLQPA